MTVVAEQGGELYALLVDQVREVHDASTASDRSSAIRRPSTRWAEFSAASTGWTDGC